MNQALAQDYDLPPVSMEFDPLQQTTLDGNINQARWKDDNKLTVRFRKEAILNPSRSTKENRAVFDEVDFITIWTPGSQLSVIDAPVKSGFYTTRFAEQYAKWKAGVEQAVSGTPLEHFPFLFQKVGLTAELKAMHILTVEQLAGLPDSAAGKIMGGHDLRKLAGEWLSKSKSDAADAEKEDMKKQLAALQAQLAVLTSAKATKEK